MIFFFCFLLRFSFNWEDNYINHSRQCFSTFPLHLKYSTTHCIFNSPLNVWKCGSGVIHCFKNSDPFFWESTVTFCQGFWFFWHFWNFLTWISVPFYFHSEISRMFGSKESTLQTLFTCVINDRAVREIYIWLVSWKSWNPVK